MNELDARLTRLERENRWLKAAALGALAVCLMGQDWGIIDVVRARSVLIVDNHGTTRIGLGVGDDGNAAVSLHDGAGDISTMIWAEPNGTSQMMISAAEATPAVYLCATRDGVAGIEWRSTRRSPVAYRAVTTDGAMHDSRPSTGANGQPLVSRRGPDL